MRAETARGPLRTAPRSASLFWLNTFLLFKRTATHRIASLISFSALTVNMYPVRLPFDKVSSYAVSFIALKS